MTKEKTVTITIDNKVLHVKPGLTILQAAKANNIYIPSLCALEHLPSYGACRLCIVEVDGIRGFPTSCTTPVEEGMVIRTDTQELRNLRQEILKLLLSEHPASCLFCTDRDECSQFQGTIRKVGYTTGCRYCPNDHKCEIQTIVEKIGLTETAYPVYYRNFPIENYDPFYDRDYNLCILCGRCIRVCNDIRLNGTLSFKQRGQHTTIGPAFDRTHLEAGCEFCGACVSVCPTGTLSVKTGKWYGAPESEGETICNFCSIGCELKLQLKNNSVIDSLPNYDSPIDKGLICVKGRFCITEYVHTHLRYSTPVELTPVGYNSISWEQALDKATEKIKDAKPDEIITIVSPQLLNEDYYMIQYFMRKVIGSENILPSTLLYLGKDFITYWNLYARSQPLEVIEESQCILTIGFDSTYGYSPIGIMTKRAARSDTVLVTINNRETNLDLIAYSSFINDVSLWHPILKAITGRNGKEKTKKAVSERPLETIEKDLKEIRNTFSKSKKRLIILGEDVLNYPERTEILSTLVEMVKKDGWDIIVANPFTNLKGMMLTGCFPEILPGEILKGKTEKNTKNLKAEVLNPDFNRKVKIIFIVGDVPKFKLPECEFLIYQNALPPNLDRNPDLILPSSVFPEIEGTIVNIQGDIMHVKKAIEPYMESKPDWLIIQSLAERLKKGKMKFKDIKSIQDDIKKFVKGFPKVKERLEFSDITLKGSVKFGGSYPIGDVKKATYRGIALSSVVAGMKVIERSIDE